MKKIDGMPKDKEMKKLPPNTEFPEPKWDFPKPKGKQGQQLLVGIMIMVMAVILFIAILPAIKSIMDDARSCEYLNCAGYVDIDATGASCGSSNKSYSEAADEDGLSCTILDLGIPYLILGVLVGLVGKLIAGRLVEPQPPQQYGYGGY